MTADDEVQAFDVPISSQTGGVGGTVPPTLSLTLGPAPAFGAFTPGVARDYFASTTATVTSTAGDAALIVLDPSAFYTNRLVNGSFALAQELRVRNHHGRLRNDAGRHPLLGRPDGQRVGADRVPPVDRGQ